MTAEQAFEIALDSVTEEERDTEEKLPPVPFTLVDTDGVKHQFVAVAPNGSAFFLMAATASRKTTAVKKVGSMMHFLEMMFTEEEFTLIEDWLFTGELPPEKFEQVLNHILGKWSEDGTGFPTKPSSDSSRSQRRAGTRSTGRAPGAGSTRSASRSAGS